MAGEASHRAASSTRGRSELIGPDAYWPADVSEPLDHRPIGLVLADWAGTTPDATAVAWHKEDDIASLTYRELYAEATGFAARLLAMVATGDPVAVFAGSSRDWLVLEYAAALAGTPLVPVNPAFTDHEVQHILEASAAAALFVDAEFRGSSLLARARDLAMRTPVDSVHLLSDWSDLPSSSTQLPELDSAHPFLIQFTSGTTGGPKGALLSHRAAFNCARLSVLRLGARQDDNWLNVLPMHHVGGSVSVALAILAVGATITIVPAFEPGLVLRLLERTRATIMGGVPTMQLALLEHPDFATTDLSSLRIVQSGGTTVAPSLIRRAEQAFGAAVVVAYGQSESPNAIQTDAADDDVTKAQTIGTPLPQREVRIVDSGGRTVGLGERGELWMRSPMVMDRYVGVDDATAAATLDASGWLHTGDLCSMDGRGVLTIHGRVRDVIIRGGENIYPAEVEDVLLQHPAIADVAVVGVTDDRWGEVPVACYRPASGSAVDSSDLERHARASLASFKVPRRWVPFDSFPLTASGKVKKFALRAHLECPVRNKDVEIR
jgi:fatty-acyl-CoA synthase